MVIMNNAQRQGQQLDTIHSPDGVRLQPFLHQVSGRSTMMCLNETTVCKPLNSREYCFYQSLPRDILKYTPEYKGVVNVNIEETKDGTIALTAFPPSEEESEHDHIDTDSDDDDEVNIGSDSKNYSESCKRARMQASSTGERGSRKRIRIKRTGSLCIVRADDGLESDVEKSPYNPRFNPWTLKVYRDSLTRHLHSKSKIVQKCILLENVTSRFKFPCILDLKMGTRVHGDFDDDEKRKRHLEKCANTTTQSLGVRLAGMQVYRHESGTFLCRNKYFGRELTVEGFHKTLKEFFNNGCCMRRDVIHPIIEKLKSLIKRLNQLPSYRFYSSSLLIMYDGATSPDDAEQEEQNTELTAQSSNNRESEKVSTSTECSSESSESSESFTEKKTRSSSVDVRMIDFAKSTHRNMNESVVHKGPDKGYIFGLESLVQVLSSIVVDEVQ